MNLHTVGRDKEVMKLLQMEVREVPLKGAAVMKEKHHVTQINNQFCKEKDLLKKFIPLLLKRKAQESRQTAVKGHLTSISKSQLKLSLKYFWLREGR